MVRTGKNNNMQLAVRPVPTEDVYEDLPDPTEYGTNDACWQCFEPRAETSCERCSKRFHGRCLSEDAEELSYGCNYCKIADKRHPHLASSEDFRTALTYILRKAEEKSWAVHLSSLPDDNIKINFDIIRELIANHHYHSTELFLADIRSILYNMVTRSTRIFAETLAAHFLSIHCAKESYEFDRCADCFLAVIDEDRISAFTRVCKLPHALVWAKYSRYPPWPAKVYNYVGESHIYVRFFGSVCNAIIPVANCYLISQQQPLKKDRSCAMKRTLAHLQHHIDNLKAAYGTFVYSDRGMRLSDTTVEEFTRRMLPEWRPRQPNLCTELVPVASPQEAGTSNVNCRSEVSHREMEDPMDYNMVMEPVSPTPMDTAATYSPTEDTSQVQFDGRQSATTELLRVAISSSQQLLKAEQGLELSRLIAELAAREDSCRPRFVGYEMSNYTMSVEATDEASRAWLLAIIPQQVLWGGNLSAWLTPQPPRKGTLYLPCNMPPQEALQELQKQNQTNKIKSWGTGEHASTEHGMKIEIILVEEEVRKLQESSFLLFWFHTRARVELEELKRFPMQSLTE